MLFMSFERKEIYLSTYDILMFWYIVIIHLSFFFENGIKLRFFIFSYS